MKALLALSLLILLGLSASASNLLREQRVADDLTSNIQSGDPVKLAAGTRTFLGIHQLSASREVLGGVILLHDMDAHPNEADVIRPLRTHLPKRGWETLSIQLPLAAQNAEATEYGSLTQEALVRIQAAVGFYTGRQNRNLILIGHGLGASWGLKYLKETPAREVRAFVAIGLTRMILADQQAEMQAIETLEIPMLDLIGSQDRSALQNAGARLAAARRSGRSAYRQDRVSGADHLFSGLGDVLPTRVGGWIGKVAPGMER